MSDGSTIEWTEATWNPTRGCDKVSPGCKHCYAETFAERFRGVPGHPYEQGFDFRLAPNKLAAPLHWKKPRRVFVNSMSDLFHKDVPNEYIAAVFGVMAACQQHTFQILTKRAERLPEWFDWVDSGDGHHHRINDAVRDLVPGAAQAAVFPTQRHGMVAGVSWPLPNVHLGVSAEDQATADERIPHLLRVPAAVHWVSAEPMLGPIDLSSIAVAGGKLNALTGRGWYPSTLTGVPVELNAPPLSWLVVGGESGQRAREFRIEWARSIVAQCRAAGTPVFVKQLGASPSYETFPGPDGETMAIKLRSRKGGDPNEWPADLRVREFPA